MCKDRLSVSWFYMQKFQSFHTYAPYNLYSFKIYEVHTSLFKHLIGHSTEFA